MTNNKVNPQFKLHNSDIFLILKYQNFFSKIFLIAPYNITGSIGCRTIHPIKNNNLLYILLCLFIIGLVLSSLYSFLAFGVGLRILQASINSICVAVLVLYTFFRKTIAVKMLKNFARTEKFFQENGMRYSRKKFRLIMAFEYLLILFICSCAFALLEFEYFKRHNLSTFPVFLLSNILIILFIFQYINYILILKDWLMHLKVFLENLFYANTQEIDQKLFIARIAYDEIFKLSKLIEEYYQIPLLFMEAGSFLNSTVYLNLWYITTRARFSTYFWLLFNLFKLLCTSFICEMCVNEDQAVRYAFRKLGSLTFGKNFNRENMHGLAMTMAEKRIVFELCGMFTMNREFVVSVIGAVTIYVVILQQNNVKSE